MTHLRRAPLILAFLLLAGCAEAGPPPVVDHRIPGSAPRVADPAAAPVAEPTPSQDPAAGSEPSDADALPPGIVGSLEAADLDESSGLVASRLHPGLFWSLNDSGGDPELFAIGRDGSDKGRVQVRFAIANDWEDLAIDPQGAVWIHDGGNNKNRRRDLTVYRVPEPEALQGVVDADRAVRFVFPDQDAFPSPGNVNFDSEALFWDGDRLLLLTKHRSDTHTKLYRFPAGIQTDPTWDPVALLAPGKKPPGVVLELLGAFDLGGDPDNFGGKVTAADLSPDGRRLAVLTYHALFVFERPEGTPNWLAGPHRRIDFEQLVTMQCEAISWDGGALLFTNEQRAVMRITNPLDPACVRFPSQGCRTR